MIPILSLWMPIVLSAVLVWVASAIVWMVLPHHKKDFAQVPDEAGVRAALKGIAPGQYNLPHVVDSKQLADPTEKAKFDDGPVGFLTVLPTGVPSMGRNLILTFLFYLVVGDCVAYLAGRTLPPGTNYLEVFRITGTVAFIAYGFATVQDAVWFGRPWSSVAKGLADALLYGLLTGGAFGWLWPSA